MQKTAYEIAEALYFYLKEQTEPLTKTTLKTRFFAMCRPPYEFETVMEHLVLVDAIQQRTVAFVTKPHIVVFATPRCNGKVPSGGKDKADSWLKATYEPH